MKNLVLIIIFMVLSFEGFSQHSFGIEFGQVNQRQFGTHQFDSIVVIPSGNETLNTRFLGLFFEMELSDKFALHTKLTHSRAFTRYLYYNENNEVFPGIFERKVSGPSVTRVSWEILPQFSLVKFGKMEMNVFGGVNISANIVKDDAELAFRGLPGVSKVGNAFRTSQLPITLNFALGGSIEYARRIVFWTKWQPTSFYSRDIVIDGERYPFENRWNFFTTTIGYKFYSLRFKKKDGI